jgi:hypothetical protein
MRNPGALHCERSGLGIATLAVGSVIGEIGQCSWGGTPTQRK